MRVEVDQSVPAFDSYAVERARGLYNVGVADGQRFRLQADLPVEKDDWQIGVVVGPSGSGKSSILRELGRADWHEPSFMWSDQPIIEELGSEDFARATASLAAVGLGSVPSWLRPRQVLSMGEGFRADMARLLMSTQFPEAKVLLDEFTSVLDRQVAKIGAGAFAKAWRRVPGRRVILFTCHYDVLEWVEPDWYLDTSEGLDQFAEDRGVVVAQEGDFQRHKRRRYSGDHIANVVC